MTNPPSRRRTRSAVAAAATGLAVTAALFAPATAGNAAAAVPGAAPGASPQQSPPVRDRTTVTLVTGDTVTVTTLADGHQTAEVERPRGAVGGVRTQTVGKDVYVLPDEALPYVAARKLDRRLFDVSALVRDRYDDAHTDGLPLLVSYTAARSAARSAAAPAGATVTRPLPGIRGAAVRARKKDARRFWDAVAPAAARSGKAAPALGNGIARIWLDGRVKAQMADSNAQIGTAAAWSAGYDGKGVKVAVLDTGYDTHHPDLAGRVGDSASFVPGETVEDGFGHGTHVLSTVGGSGAASDGREKGVAPGADLLVGKVLGNDGWGQESWIIAGMEWAAHSGARVVSMSLGSTDAYDGTDAESTALDNLTAETGALFVVAAGNRGCEGCIGSPGAADAALTVGAVDSQDRLAYFSSRGPRFRDYAMKPDIAAPGVGILAAKAGGTAATGWYTRMDGTSMATPHVAGAAALLAQEHPGWRAQQLKDALMSTAKRLDGYDAYAVGAGRLSVPDAVDASVTATGSAYFGFVPWGQADGGRVDRTLTYTNTSDAPVTLHLRETAAVAGGPYDGAGGGSGPGPRSTAARAAGSAPAVGDAAPEGMFTLGADTVTVPAHGTADVTASAEPRLGAPGTRYLGQVTATDDAGAVRTRTQVGLYEEDERYTLHVAVKDREGGPAGGTLVYQQVGDPDFSFAQVDPGTGTADLRWRRGTYNAFMLVDVQGSGGPDTQGLALMGDPELVLDHDRDLVLDARRAVPVKAVVPHETEPRFRQMEWYRSPGGTGSDSDTTYLLPARYDDMFVLPTEKVTGGSFEYNTRWRLAKPLLKASDGGTDLPVAVQAGSGLYDGSGTLDAVWAGDASAPDFGAVRGRIAVVAVGGGFDGPALARSAADAGARLVLLANTLGGRLSAWVGDPDGGRSRVPVASVPTAAAQRLLAEVRAGGARLHLEGTPDTPYVYDLQDAHAGRVPDALTYRPRASDLARVDMRFHGGARAEGSEFRWDFRPHRTREFAFQQVQTMPATRVDYVSAEPGTGWHEDLRTGPDSAWESRGPGIVSYGPGQHVVREWFGPVVAPRNGVGYWLSKSDYGWTSVNLQPWSDGGDGTAGTIDGPTASVVLKAYKNGTLVKTNTYDASAHISTAGDTAPAAIGLDLEARRDGAVYGTSIRTHTVWSTHAPLRGPDDGPAVLPLLQLDYRVATDLAGAASGGVQTVGLSAYHLKGAEGGTVGAPTLDVSFDDGGTWQPARVARGADGTWSTVFTAPDHGFVSLRAAASDDRGNAVTQEVVRAYGLKG
ncbi:S8 family serine peptidase [Streptomyces sp. NPDC001380]|uniref:S8 family serine peptidase n=1 Tax=Streptomyces sp. NPDC001380 TaxID=3364566 RepID=UPI0036BB8C84